jgi:hypothetical protein
MEKKAIAHVLDGIEFDTASSRKSVTNFLLDGWMILLAGIPMQTP